MKTSENELSILFYESISWLTLDACFASRLLRTSGSCPLERLALGLPPICRFISRAPRFIGS